MNLFNNEEKQMQNLERMLVAIDSNDDGYVVVAKGFVMEDDIENLGSRDLEDLGIPFPEDGLPAVLAVFETRPYYSGGGYDAYNGDYHDAEPVYDGASCGASWRILTAEEWAIVVRGDLQGLLRHWDDVKSRDEVQTEQDEALDR